MALQYPQTELFSEVSKGATELGQSLNKARQFKNIVPAIQSSQERGASVPLAERYKNLGVTTTPYMRRTRFEAAHPGIDLAAAPETPIPAVASGVVTDIKTGQVRGSPGFGNYVIVQDAQGNQFRYSHLSSSYVPVKLGQQVATGTILGGMGNTGQVYSSTLGGSGTHLDLRIKNYFDQYVDPMKYLGNQ